MYQGLSLAHRFLNGGHLANHVSAFYKGKCKCLGVHEKGSE